MDNEGNSLPDNKIGGEMKNALKLLLLVAFIAGCSSTGTIKKTEMPDWVMNTKKWTETQKTKAFYGVGRGSADIKDKSLRMEAAENMARTEIMKSLRQFSGYAAENYTGDKGVFMERTNRVFAEGYVSGTQIAERWYEKDGTAYALAEFDLEKAKSLIEMSKELDDASKDFLKKNAEDLYQRVKKSALEAK
jgi:hypothetical protein